MRRSWSGSAVFFICDEHGLVPRMNTLRIGGRRFCRPCRNEAGQRWRRANPERWREQNAKAFETARRAGFADRTADHRARHQSAQVQWKEHEASRRAMPLVEARTASALGTPTTFRLLNARCPTWPQWVDLLAVVMAPATPDEEAEWHIREFA